METVTFYSYKGGSGRTLLLANAARYFAMSGKRVVALDLDFEAPGLHYKLNIGAPGERTADIIPRGGVVDWLVSALDDGAEPRALLRDLTVSVPVPAEGDGGLWLLPAGAAPSGKYWKQLTGLFRTDPFLGPDSLGLPAMLELKARIEDEYRPDLLLVDSRTGITELSGIATSVLADKVVCLFLNNRESLAGAREVMRSLRKAARLNDDGIEVVPVLSRVKTGNWEAQQAVQRAKQAALRFLNENGRDDALDFEELYVLHTDPGLDDEEALHIGSGREARRAQLYSDYLSLFSELSGSDEAGGSSAWGRYQAVQRMVDWLTDDDERGRHRRRLPATFDVTQIDEGVRLGRRESRYADLVVFSGDDKAEALLAAEYVGDDLEASEAWRWWQANTRLRCIVLFDGENRRVFTRGRRRDFFERNGREEWAVTWPASFQGLDDPGDRSIAGMVTAVQRGEDEFIPVLVQEWQHASLFGIHGPPFRPYRRAIIDGLAQVRDEATEGRILWYTAPDPFDPFDPFERVDAGFREGGVRLEEHTTRELHAPLWWRLSAKAKVDFWHGRGHPMEGTTAGGVELLAQDLMGLSFDEDTTIRDAVATLLGADEESARLVSERELRFKLSEDDVPEDLVRRVQLERAAHRERPRPSGDDAWSAAEAVAQEVVADDEALNRLYAVDGRLTLVTTHLLGTYASSDPSVTVFRPVVAWCARLLGVDVRALENVVLLHQTVHAMCHLGRDLDGRSWKEFALPSPRDPSYGPSALHEGLAQYFTYRMLERLGDDPMMVAFDKLSSVQPKEYQRWREMRDVPVERVREILMQARAGLGDELGMLR